MQDQIDMPTGLSATIKGSKQVSVQIPNDRKQPIILHTGKRTHQAYRLHASLVKVAKWETV